MRLENIKKGGKYLRSIYDFSVPTNIVIGQNSVFRIIAMIEKYFPHVGLADIKALIVSDNGLVKVGLTKTVENILAENNVSFETYYDVKANPTDNDIEKAFEFFMSKGCSFIIAIGGGSVIDTAKAVALRTSNEKPISKHELPSIPKASKVNIFAIPTTAGSGSEVTPFTVITNSNEKRKAIIYSPSVLPKVAILDPLLTISLPPKITAETGIDALTHAIEAYVSLYANPISDALAYKAIQLIFQNLCKAFANGNNVIAREKMLVASMLGGVAATNAGLGIIHSLSHPLTDLFNLTHGLANAIMLPHGMEFNLIATPEKYASIAEATGEPLEGFTTREKAEISVESIKRLLIDLDLDFRLKKLGIKNDDLNELAKRALKIVEESSNPRKASLRDLIIIYQHAL